MGEVKIWEERIVIPTYEVGEPDKNPMFLEKRRVFDTCFFYSSLKNPLFKPFVAYFFVKFYDFICTCL
ncbi:hypothetical protein B5E82_17690 [Lachnoclostridium sp. An138]|nr:hypothetical protein B5E82_17690 [Lachnoclostridium sp. An138]